MNIIGRIIYKLLRDVKIYRDRNINTKKRVKKKKLKTKNNNIKQG